MLLYFKFNKSFFKILIKIPVGVTIKKNITFDQTYKDSFIKNLKTNNLNSKFVKLLDKDRDMIILESCDVITSICEKREYNFYNIDDMKKEPVKKGVPFN